jgi:hypothetical protein
MLEKEHLNFGKINTLKVNSLDTIAVVRRLMCKIHKTQTESNAHAFLFSQFVITAIKTHDFFHQNILCSKDKSEKEPNL